MSDPLAAFEAAAIDAAAADADLDPDTLRALIRRQQRLVREFPDMTVEALVHDWRTRNSSNGGEENQPTGLRSF